jgi:hypothetical protein
MTVPTECQTPGCNNTSANGIRSHFCLHCARVGFDFKPWALAWGLVVVFAPIITVAILTYEGINK